MTTGLSLWEPYISSYFKQNFRALLFALSYSEKYPHEHEFSFNLMLQNKFLFDFAGSQNSQSYPK